MKRLYILGAGGFGRELFSWVSQHPDHGRAWRIEGFIDDNLEALAGYDYDVPVVSSISSFSPGSDDLLACGLGTPALKEALCPPLAARGATFARIVHPTAVIGRNVTLGAGVVLCPYVVLTCDITVGDFVTFNCRSGCGHDVTVGDFTTVSSLADIMGGCRVGRGVFFGSGASVFPGRTVGDYAMVGAGSVATRRVAPGSSVFGAPAVVIRPGDSGLAGDGGSA